MADMLLRFLIGGLVVSAFAVIGDMVKPESLGGVFAAAPTIALATIPLTLHKHGAVYTAQDARSMVGGAIAFFCYACVVSFVLMRKRTSAMKTAGFSLAVWAAVASVLWAMWLRG
jgi:uncharacterized membrane protein (GlpM family)